MNRRYALLAVGAITVALLLGGCSASNTTSAGSAAQANSSAQAVGAPAQATPGQSGASRQGQARVPVLGPVASVSGNTLTITTQQGDTKVNIAGARIQKSMDGTTDDLKAGVTVVVTGRPGSDGTVTATNIQITPVGALAEGAPQSERQPPGQGRAQAPSQGQSQGQPQNRGQGMRPIFGTVGSLQGDTLTVNDQQGNTIQVKVTGARIEKTVDGTVDDLKAGVTVSVVGQRGSDGTIAATSIQIRPAGSPANGPFQGGRSQATPVATPAAN